MNEFLKRFASIPDILELDHLTVSGNVTFGKGVSLKGTVIIIANQGDRVRKEEFRTNSIGTTKTEFTLDADENKD